MADLSAANFTSVDANNNAASPNGWTPGTMLPNQVEPVMQATTGALKRFWERTNAQITTTGASGAYTYTPSNASYPTSIVQGEVFSFLAHQDAAGNDTFTIAATSPLGPYNIYLATQAGTRQIKAKEIVSGQFCSVRYSTSLGGMVLQTAADISSYSPAFTGVPTVPTAPVGTNTAQVANMAALQQAAFSAALPLQTGKADYVPTTDGTNASWTNRLKSTVMGWKDGTDATKQMTYDLTGITTGNTRSMKVPDKNGTLALASDVHMALLATLTPTAAANLDALSVFSSTYDNYRIIAQGILSNYAAGADTLTLRVAVGGVVDSGSNYISVTVGSATSTSATSMALGAVQGSASPPAGHGATFDIRILNANDATSDPKVIIVDGAGASTQAAGVLEYAQYSSGCAYPAVNPISGFRLYWSTGSNFVAQGKIYIYGYN